MIPNPNDPAQLCARCREELRSGPRAVLLNSMQDATERAAFLRELMRRGVKYRLCARCAVNPVEVPDA